MQTGVAQHQSAMAAVDDEAAALLHDPPSYAAQDCALTLREGLAEHYRRNSALLDPQEMQEPMATFFLRHDCVHVVYGLTTRLEDEVMADSVTIFGVDISTRQYAKALAAPEVMALLKGISVWDFAKASLKALPRLWRAFWASRKQRKPWRWAVDDETLDTPINALRQAHGITVV